MTEPTKLLTYDDIVAKVKSALTEVTRRPDIAQLEARANLVDDVGLDSMSVLAFFMALEEQIDGFRIDVDSVETSDLQTIDTVATFVHRRLP